MSRHLPKNLDPLKLSVSMYVLARVAQGLAGVPANPKKPALIGYEAQRSKIEAKIAREIAFDSDLWIVEVEDRKGRNFLDLA